MFWKIIYLIWILLEIDKAKSEDIFHPTARVHDMSPNDISNMGGVITVYGKNFAKDNFNQFDANLGNRVIILSKPSVFLEWEFFQNCARIPLPSAFSDARNIIILSK